VVDSRKKRLLSSLVRERLLGIDIDVMLSSEERFEPIHIGNRIGITTLSCGCPEGVTMTAMDYQISDYLEWMKIHNYARTTIENRRRYLGYFSTFSHAEGIDDPASVSFECLLRYQQELFNHRKRDGLSLSFGTQVQRLYQ
jgi:hypothetical protein